MKKIMLGLCMCIGLIQAVQAQQCNFQFRIYTTMPWHGHWFYPNNVSYTGHPFDSTMYFLDIDPQDSVLCDYNLTMGINGCYGMLWDWGIYKDGIIIDSVPGWQSFEKGLKEDGIYDLYAWNFSGRAHFRIILAYANTTNTDNLPNNSINTYFDQTSNLQLKFKDEASLSSIRLYNITGQEVYWHELADVWFGDNWQSPTSLHYLPRGVYVCELRDIMGKTSSQKVFKP